MALEAQQIRKLRASLRSRHIKTREVDGKTLSYVEGWHVIAEANRIFGFDGWDRELVDHACVYTKQVGDRFNAAYTARIRVTVRAGDTRIIREGSGAGEASAASPGQAHELAMKAAETDATKRALMTFGNPFGLSLYGQPKANGAKPPAILTQSAPTVVPLPDATVPASAAPEAPATSAALIVPEADAVSKAGAGASTDVAPPHTTQTKVQTLGRIDKSVLPLAEPRRLRDPEHLRYVASRGCIVCGRNRALAHHLRFTQPSAMARKVSDEFTVPLCPEHHRDLHRYGNEREWWHARHIDAVAAAANLWAKSRAGPADQPSRQASS
jgi:DNA recombination protein Rad52